MAASSRGGAQAGRIIQSRLSPREQQVFAAGYTEAVEDRAGELHVEAAAAKDSEIRRLQCALATAQADLEKARRTAAALDQEAARYFEQLRETGAFDAELDERKSAYRARQAEAQRRSAERARAGRPAYHGGAIAWPASGRIAA